MKKFFAIFLCIFILFFNTISVKAMDIGVAIEVGQEVFYAGWDQIMSLINGVVIPTSQYAGAADKAAAMAAFYDDWLGTLSGLTQYWGGDIADAETGAISINYPLDYGMSGRYANQFLTEYANLTQDVNNGFALPLNGNVLAAWNRYNNLWIQRYLNSFNGVNDHPEYADPDYQSDIDLINGSGFKFENYPNSRAVNANMVETVLTYPYVNYSWVCNTSRNNDMTNLNATNIQIDFTTYANAYPCDLLDINITSYNNLYTVDVTADIVYPAGMNSWNDDFWSAVYFNYSTETIEGRNSLHPNYVSGSFSGSLSECFSWIAKRFRNVNLYVNGVLWSYVGGDFVEKINAPDVIRNETGQIIGNDVYFPEEDLMIDLINWQNLVDDKILSGEDITFDDLIDAGVITDAEGNIIDNDDLDSYFKKKSISSVIDDALDDTQAIALVPDLPVPPNPNDTDPFNWNFPEFIPDIPDVDFAPRQTGLSILARIINVTNQSLPGELIAMFWGIVITLVILGIIKIAHK